jgi:hypothetical protein
VKMVVPTPGSLDSIEIMGITRSTQQTGPRPAFEPPGCA